MALVQHHRLMLLFCMVTSIHTRSSQISDLKSKISGVEELLEEFRKQLQQDQADNRDEKEEVDVCLGDFDAVEEHIIRARASIEQGATFLSVPDRVYSWKDCLHACCADHHCTLAVVQEDLRQSDDSLSCYLFNCTYRNKNVCSFAAQAGFSTYTWAHNTTGHLTSSVGNGDANKLVHLIRRPEKKPAADDGSQMQDMDEPPRSDAGQDVVIQLPTDWAVLDARDSVDDHGVAQYKWVLVKGDPDVNMKVTHPGLLKISGLQEGVYIFQMTVTDTAGQRSSDNVTVMVLAPERQAKVDGNRKSVAHPSGQTSSQKPVAQPDDTEDHSMTEGGPGKTMEDARPPPPQALQIPQSVGRGRVVPNGLPQSSNSGEESPVSKVEPCSELPAVGPCKGAFPRWFYDPAAGECKHFIYGGCKGNRNSFLQKTDCVSECTNGTGGPAIKATTMAPEADAKQAGTADVLKVTMKWPEIDSLTESEVIPIFKSHTGHPVPESGLFNTHASIKYLCNMLNMQDSR